MYKRSEIELPDDLVKEATSEFHIYEIGKGITF